MSADDRLRASLIHSKLVSDRDAERGFRIRTTLEWMTPEQHRVRQDVARKMHRDRCVEELVHHVIAFDTETTYSPEDLAAAYRATRVQRMLFDELATDLPF